MELTIIQYVLLYFIYSCAGWLLEVICKLKETKKFVNRGFLIGPYCPIYGWGAIGITFLLYKYRQDPLVLFVMTVVSCGTLEYLTSWAMEKLFNARWWDYTRRKFNLNGRICLGTLVPFGIFGLMLTYVTNPLIINGLNKVDGNILKTIAILTSIIYIIDNIISAIVIIGFRKTTVQVSKERKQDNTEEITKKVKDILLSKSWTYKRLINSYPKFVAIKYKIKEITDEVRENAQEIKNNINEKAQDVKNNINYKKASLKLSRKRFTRKFTEKGK